MINTLKTYCIQRFNPLVFGLLTAFLLIYAKGNFTMTQKDWLVLPPLVLALFYFRLFDDLQNKKEDAHKHDRIYKHTEAADLLSNVLVVLVPLLLVSFFLLNTLLTQILAIFLVVNYLLYAIFRHSPHIKTLLPFLKYPLLCYMLLVYFDDTLMPRSPKMIFCLLLLPAFLVFEKLEDNNNPIIAYLFLLVLLITCLIFVQ